MGKRRKIILFLVLLGGLLAGTAVVFHDNIRRVWHYQCLLKQYDAQELLNKPFSMEYFPAIPDSRPDTWIDLKHTRFIWPFGPIEETFFHSWRLKIRAGTIEVFILPTIDTSEASYQKEKVAFEYSYKEIRRFMDLRRFHSNKEQPPTGRLGYLLQYFGLCRTNSNESTIPEQTDDPLEKKPKEWLIRLFEQQQRFPWAFMKDIMDSRSCSRLDILLMNRLEYDMHCWRLEKKYDLLEQEEIRFFETPHFKGYMVCSIHTDKVLVLNASLPTLRTSICLINEAAETEQIILLDIRQTEIPWDKIDRLLASLTHVEKPKREQWNATFEAAVLEQYRQLPGFYTDADTLAAAMDLGDNLIIEKLLPCLRDVNEKTYIYRPDSKILYYHNATLLHGATAAANTDLVKLILQHGGNINAQAENGDTPLHTAVRQNNLKIVQILLENDADPAIEDILGITPFDNATGEIATLLKARQNIAASDDFAITPQQAIEKAFDHAQEAYRRDRKGPAPLKHYLLFKNTPKHYYAILWGDTSSINNELSFNQWIKVDGISGQVEVVTMADFVYWPIALSEPTKH